MVRERDQADALESGLRIELESHLPESLTPGSQSAVFCFGHCFHRSERVADLALLVDGQPHRPTAARMPRRDLFAWLGETDEDPAGHSYRSGFWAIVPARAGLASSAVTLEASVRLASGAQLRRALGRIEVSAGEPAAMYPDAQLKPGTIAICMATFDPEPALLSAQLASLREQTDERWICLISDGGSDPERFAQLIELVGGDERFVVSRSERRLGPWRNFERALSMVPPRAELVALCDQDDRWYPDKLAALRGALGSTRLAYSDLRLVADDGRVLRDSLWHGRRNDYRNLASMLVANTVPGASMLFRRELLDLALPFPEAPGVPYHDHWLALVALSSGEISYVDRPLYDWVQHPAAVSLGATDSAIPAGLGSAVREGLRRAIRDGSRGWRAAYFGGFVTRQLLAETLLLRCASPLTPRKRRALARFVAAATSPVSFMWLVLRPLRRLVGRDETLGGESALARGILWRWLIVLAVGRAERPGRRAYDAAFPDPPQFEQRRLRRWRGGA